MGKHSMVQIELSRKEGGASCTAITWQDANDWLSLQAKTAPHFPESHLVEYRIKYKNGHEFSGGYELTDLINQDLGRNIYCRLAVMAGIERPPYFSEEEYEKILNERPLTRGRAINFMSWYDIGYSTDGAVPTAESDIKRRLASVQVPERKDLPKDQAEAYGMGYLDGVTEVAAAIAEVMGGSVL